MGGGHGVAAVWRRGAGVSQVDRRRRGHAGRAEQQGREDRTHGPKVPPQAGEGEVVARLAVEARARPTSDEWRSPAALRFAGYFFGQVTVTGGRFFTVQLPGEYGVGRQIWTDVGGDGGGGGIWMFITGGAFTQTQLTGGASAAAASPAPEVATALGAALGQGEGLGNVKVTVLGLGEGVTAA
jgi:hypothetical protein